MFRLPVYSLLAVTILALAGGIRSANSQPAAASDDYTTRIQPIFDNRCVACHSFNYAWDDEWNAGMLASALRGENVESGIVALRVPERAGKIVGGGSKGNTLDMHDDG